MTQKIKALLYVEGFYNPIKTTELLVDDNLTDIEIIELAKEPLFKDFRIEIEDKTKDIIETHFKQKSPRVLEVNGVKYQKNDIMKKHNLSESQYYYLRSNRKISMLDIFLKGRNLFSRKTKSWE